jgi:hypothetical protein
LHIERALDVSNFGQPAAGIVRPRLISEAAGVVRGELIRNRYFVVEEIVLSPGSAFQGRCDGSTLEIWGCMTDEVAIGYNGAASVTLPAIRFALLPAALGAFEITASTPSVCLRAYLPEVAPSAAV